MIIHRFEVRRAGMCLAGCLLLTTSGCSSMQHGAERIANLARGEATSKPDKPEAASAQAKAVADEAEVPESVALDNRVESALASGAWVASVPKTGGPPPEYRWRHPLLESLPGEKHTADFRKALASKKPLVAVNARLALARYQKEATGESLVEIVQDREHPLPVRLAAVEMLGKLDPPEKDRLRQLLRECGARELYPSPHYVPDLHAELLYALVQGNGATGPDTETGGGGPNGLSADDQALCTTGLASPSPLVRIAAVRAWLAAGNAPLPAELLDRRTDADPRVRALVMGAIGKWPPEQAGDHLIAALQDNDLTVRLAAIGSLGQLTDEVSLNELRRLMNHDAEMVRAAVIAALARRGQDDAMTEAIEDTSWHVRQTVARLLADSPHEHRKMLAARLLADASPQVQQQMAVSLATWPLEEAGPLLLSAMGQSGFLVRKAAREELAKRWQAAEEFSVDAPAEGRAEKLASLREKWQTEMASSNDSDSKPQNKPAPKGSPVTSLVSQVQTGTLAERRRAADQLAQQAAKGALEDEAAQALCEAVIRETDMLLWRSALTSLVGNLSEPATRLAYAGLSHPSPEIRRRACEHLRQHPDPRHKDVLVTSLEDTDPEVVRAAVHALVACGGNADPAPLERLLTVADKSLRIDAAEALVRLGAVTGRAALERLTQDSDPAVRQQAATALGRTGDETALPALMRLLDDQGGVRQAALASLAQIAGKDIARADQPEPPTNSVEEVRRWRSWHLQRR